MSFKIEFLTKKELRFMLRSGIRHTLYNRKELAASDYPKLEASLELLDRLDGPDPFDKALEYRAKKENGK